MLLHGHTRSHYSFRRLRYTGIDLDRLNLPLETARSRIRPRNRGTNTSAPRQNDCHPSQRWIKKGPGDIQLLSTGSFSQVASRTFVELAVADNQIIAADFMKAEADFLEFECYAPGHHAFRCIVDFCGLAMASSPFRRYKLLMG